MKLGLLELAHAGVADGTHAAIQSVVDVAHLAEGAGLSRLWFAEHHDGKHVAAMPDLLCTRVATVVSSLRLGVAGVLLRLHAPWAVAERWAMVSHLTPAGLDLGIARGDIDAHRAFALREGVPVSPPSEFEGRVAALLSYLQGDVGPSLQPTPAPGVEVWLHGRQRASAQIAQRFGLPYCHALFLGDPTPIPSMKKAVAIAGVCARTDDEGSEWASRDLGWFRPTVIGGREAWRRELSLLRDGNGVGEVVFVDLCESPVNHLRSIELLAEVAAGL